MPFFGQSRGRALGKSRPRVLKTGEKMGQIARDAAGAAKWLLTDDVGKLILGPSSETIGTVAITGAVAIGDVDITSIATGTNRIGKFYITDGVEEANVNASNQLEVSVENAVAVTGTFYQGTQPVSGTFWQGTQPVSATDLDIRNLAPATDTVKIGDGTETVNINASNQMEVSVENAVAVTGTFWQTTQPVSGTFWQTTQPVSATDLDIRNLAPATDEVKVSDGTTTLPVAIESSAAKTSGLQAIGRYDATIPTAVSDGEAALILTDAYGVQQTTGHVANAFRAAQNQSTAQTNTELQATPGAGVSLYITDIIISNGATAGNVKLVESTADTPLDILEVMYFAINGGCVINLQTPLKLTANKNLGYTSVDCTTHSVTVAGYTAP